MALEIKQSMRLGQQLVVTPQLQQAIKLLQLSRLELNQLIQKELLENPILEESESDASHEEEEKTESEKREEAKDEDKGHDHSMEEVNATEAKGEDFKEPPDFDWENYVNTYNSLPFSDERQSPIKEPVTFENTVTQTESLQDHLLWQLHMNDISPNEQKIGEEIIGNINEDGYLGVSIEEIAKNTGFEISDCISILQKIHDFDPIGVGSRDLKECLLIQIKNIHPKNMVMKRMVEDHIDLLERHDYPKIAKALSVSQDEIKRAAYLISLLEPKPGRQFGGEQPQYIIPDVIVTRIGDEYVVTLNDDGMPKLQINRLYRQALMKGSEIKGDTKEYIQDRFKAATWLIKSIYQRQRTIYKVAKSIIKFQKGFFDNGIQDLKPLILKEVAEDVEVHESTVSRVTTNKYMHTPRGIFELKFFFNSSIQQLEGGGVASEAVKVKIMKIIKDEDKKHPLSDEDLTIKLRDSNIDIARRTVAKYRELLKIPSSSRRKER